MSNSDTAVDKLLNDGRTSIHRIAGMLSSVSYGLYYVKTKVDIPSVLSCVDDTKQSLDQAQEELKKLQEIVHSIQSILSGS